MAQDITDDQLLEQLLMRVAMVLEDALTDAVQRLPSEVDARCAQVERLARCGDDIALLARACQLITRRPDGAEVELD